MTRGRGRPPKPRPTGAALDCARMLWRHSTTPAKAILASLARDGIVLTASDLRRDFGPRGWGTPPC